MKREYFDKKELLNSLQSEQNFIITNRYKEGWNDCISAVKCMLSRLQDDVAVGSYGQWIITSGITENAVCSNCSKVFQAYYEQYAYCPNCGSKNAAS